MIPKRVLKDEEFNKVFAEFDKDNDGLITPDEFYEFMINFKDNADDSHT